jgi:membrane protein YqaA with SNARE-associated domain
VKLEWSEATPETTMEFALFKTLQKLWMTVTQQVVDGQILMGWAPGYEGWFLLHLGTFILMPDVMLVLNTLAHPQEFWVFALLAVFGSAVGAILDYSIGYWGGRPLFERLVKPSIQSRVESICKRYGGWSLVVCSLLPVPYRPLVLAIGVLKTPWPAFLAGLVAGRMLRFFLIGELIYLFHDAFAQYLQQFTWGFTLLVVLIFGVVLFRNRQRIFAVNPEPAVDAPQSQASLLSAETEQKPLPRSEAMFATPPVSAIPSAARLFKTCPPVHPEQDCRAESASKSLLRRFLL